MKFILGKKIEMTQIWKDDKIVPVTLIEAGPCYVTQIKTEETDGHNGMQIGFGATKASRLSRAVKGHLKKSKPDEELNLKYLRELKGDTGEYKLGDKIDVSIFEEGDKIKVSGTSKGKGFQGGVKRHGFHGRPATHGTKHEQRTLGSVGSAFPQRVIKGKKMPGRMGFERTTVKNLIIQEIDKEKNIIAVKGAVPGPRGALLEIKES